MKNIPTFPPELDDIRWELGMGGGIMGFRDVLLYDMGGKVVRQIS